MPSDKRLLFGNWRFTVKAVYGLSQSVVYVKGGLASLSSVTSHGNTERRKR